MRFRPLLLLCGLLPAASLPAIDLVPWRPFSPDSPWNTPISSATPTDPNSRVMIDDLASRGPFLINIKHWSIPVYFVNSDVTQKRDVGDSRPGVYGAGFEFPRKIPIPDHAVASPPVGPESDNHLAIVDRRKGLEWGMWAARQDASGRWFTGLGAVTDLKGTGVAPPWYDSRRELDSHRARASGFPLVAGLIFREEIRVGRIDHALAFAYDHCRTGVFVPPASTSQVAYQEANGRRGIPMGGRIQLNPNWDVDHSALSPAGKTIARALQEYGAYCSDYAGANVFYAENSPAAIEGWEGLLSEQDLVRVFTPDFIRQQFRVVYLGDVLPGQNFELPPPYLLEMSLDHSASLRIDQQQRVVRIPSGTKRVLATWRSHPRDSRLEFNGQVYADDRVELDFTNVRSLRLLAPNGNATEWQIVRY